MAYPPRAGNAQAAAPWPSVAAGTANQSGPAPNPENHFEFGFALSCQYHVETTGSRRLKPRLKSQGESCCIFAHFTVIKDPMQTPRFFLALCAAAIVTTWLPLRAAETDAQTKAREALEQKLNQLKSSTPGAPATNVAPAPSQQPNPAPPIAPLPAPTATPIPATTVPTAAPVTTAPAPPEFNAAPAPAPSAILNPNP